MRIISVFLVGWAVAAAVFIGLASSSRADGPRDNLPSQVRPIPPVGNDLDPADRESLQADADMLGREIETLRAQLKDRPDLVAYLPDVQIFYYAVQYPLAHHETIDPGMARKAIADGMDRARALCNDRAPWAAVSGPRGYVSRIDGSVQPYILNVPLNYKLGASDKTARPYRLDVWGHGRDEQLTELRFVEMDDHLHELKYLHQPLEPENKFILSLYGRYITAYKFAGEIDGLEAMEAVRQRYPIDRDRMLIIGFSLGGTMAWQYAVHYPDLWAAASPGAGLAETPEFLKVFQKEDVSSAPWYQQALWHLYNSTDYTANLANLPTIAYAGELDPQKQASDMMLQAAEKEGVKIDRIIGRRIGHHFTLEAKRELDQRLDEILARGRNPTPTAVRFTTWTLRYNHVDWLTVDSLEHHWKRARVDARRDNSTFTLATANVTGLTLSLPPEQSTLGAGQRIRVMIDGQEIEGGIAVPCPGNQAHFIRQHGAWQNQVPGGAPASPGTLHKRHGLQGPIDDAFMDRFLIVRPTGKPLNEQTGAWATAECNHAIDHWFKQFRGISRVKNDTEVTDEDLAVGNIVLFGDPSSNRLIARLVDKLPIQWTRDAIRLGDRCFATANHIPVMIYPNPLNTARYVVINSGFTYREYDYLNNARQTPKLPDYAVIDVTVPPSTQFPGRIAAAGFFDEDWRLQSDDGRAAIAPPPNSPGKAPSQTPVR